MRAVLEIIPILGILYVTFLLGQINQRRKYKDRRDPLPIVKYARQVVVAEQLDDPRHLKISVSGLEIALDDWDLKGR